MKITKYIVILILLIAGPIYLIAKDYSNTLSIDSKSKIKKTYNRKSPRPISDKEKSVVQKIKNFKASLPDNIKKELSAYIKDKMRLKIEGKKLYSSLSDEAKKALRIQRRMKKNLSSRVRKIYESREK